MDLLREIHFITILSVEVPHPATDTKPVSYTGPQMPVVRSTQPKMRWSHFWPDRMLKLLQSQSTEKHHQQVPGGK